MPTFQEVQSGAPITPDESLALFDSLPAAEPADLTTGLWLGSSFPPAAAGSDKLVQTGWLGKRFGGDNDVDPLVYKVLDASASTSDGLKFLEGGGPGSYFRADPIKAMALTAQGVAPPTKQKDIESNEPGAVLRAIRYRGVVTASMVYNQVPVIDHFRAVDKDTLLGVMDSQMPMMKGRPPYFFVLRRGKGESGERL